MDKFKKLFFTLLSISAISLFSAARAEEKPAHEHAGKGPNGGSIIEVGDKDDHHAEVLHDPKTGKLTVFILSNDQKTPVAIKVAPKLNLKTKAGNKQLELKGADSKWEITDDILKEEPSGRIVIVLPDGKQYNVKIEEDAAEAPKKK